MIAPPQRDQFCTDVLFDLRDVRVTYGHGDREVTALSETNLTLRKGEFTALVGPSGCGKSTILKLAAGTVGATQGQVYIAGRGTGDDVVRVGMAFQNPTLLPWLNIRDNVMLPLKIVPPFRKQYRAERRRTYARKVDDLLARVGLEGFADRYPWQLSGGMQQRASLCRALIHEPTLLLLDEPFGALDQFTREELWDVLQSLWMATTPTVLLVTHDLTEATYLASRICIMQARPGRIIDDRPVSFARPRRIELTADPVFVATKEALRGTIRAAPADSGLFDERNP